MHFSSALSTDTNLDDAIDEVTTSAKSSLDHPPDLTMVFVSSHHGPEFSEIAESIRERVETDHLIGCSGESIVGNGREVEREPALSLWLANLPDVDLTTSHLQYKSSPDTETFTGWPDENPDALSEETTMFLFGDPFTFPADKFLTQMNDDHPGIPVVGGMASGGETPGQNALLVDDNEYREGAAAAFVSGSLELETVVSQGCRPIGPHLIVTKAEGTIIQELGGEPPLTKLQSLVEDLPPRDQRLVQKGVHIGTVINEQQESFSRGDFLIRNVIGLDRDSGAMQVGSQIRTGQTVQFQVRDAESADRDLRELLEREASSEAPVSSALLFTCNGRGSRLFEEPDHDAGVLQETFGNLPNAGFFAQGELGPIGGKNFIHGYTACVTLFQDSNS